jgi:hypothetical protein
MRKMSWKNCGHRLWRILLRSRSNFVSGKDSKCFRDVRNPCSSSTALWALCTFSKILAPARVYTILKVLVFIRGRLKLDKHDVHLF